MSDSELLRIKNKQKASYKNRKTARCNLKKSFHVLMTDLGLWLGRIWVVLWWWLLLLGFLGGEFLFVVFEVFA